MGKKYLYFKLFHDLEDKIESEILSEYEIASYVNDFEIVQNVFQLYQNTELKLLINKSRQLQNLLTKSLPNHGFRHGYLWSGEHFPDFTIILSRCSLIEECLAFQKSTDPLPDFRSTAIFQTGGRFDIYNWHVYYFKSFQYYYEKAVQIHMTGDAEVDIDWMFENILEKQKKINEFDNILFLNPEGKTTTQAKINFINHDKRSYSKSYSWRWIRPILNNINSIRDSILYIPFAGSKEILIEGLFSGKKMIASEINPLRHSYLTGHSLIYETNIIQLSRAISDIVNQIKILNANHSQMQVDLFIDSTEKQFQEFWQSEQERIKNLQNVDIPVDTIKILAAARFLIESNTISNSSAINITLFNGLINLTAAVIRKKNITDVIGMYQKELRRLYLDIYIFNKIKQLSQKPGSVDHVYLQNAIDLKSIKDSSVDSICCFFPCKINDKGFKRDQIIIDILNLHPKSTKLEKHKIGLKKRTKEETQWWNDEIINKGNLFTLLGVYGQNLLTRLHNNDHQKEAASLLKLWIDGYYFLLECCRLLKVNSTACIILKNIPLKIQEEFEEIRNIQIFKELIEKHVRTMHFQIINTIQKPSVNKLFGKEEHYDILILKKIQ